VIVDSSAIVAILLREAGWERLLAALTSSDEPPKVGGGTLVETGMVLVARLGIAGKTMLARFVQEAGLQVVPVTAEHWPVAVDAFLRYGKGRHPAALNFGDCLTYAACRVSDQPLLCVGDDFPKTDLSVLAY
jgi:ribonuclease VapC